MKLSEAIAVLEKELVSAKSEVVALEFALAVTKRLAAGEPAFVDKAVKLTATPAAPKPVARPAKAENGSRPTPRPHGRQPMSTEENAKRRALYDKGMTDSEMANQLGLLPSGVKTWRKKHGLPVAAQRMTT